MSEAQPVHVPNRDDGAAFREAVVRTMPVEMSSGSPNPEHMARLWEVLRRSHRVRRSLAGARWLLPEGVLPGASTIYGMPVAWSADVTRPTIQFPPEGRRQMPDDPMMTGYVYMPDGAALQARVAKAAKAAKDAKPKPLCTLCLRRRGIVRIRGEGRWVCRECALDVPVEQLVGGGDELDGEDVIWDEVHAWRRRPGPRVGDLHDDVSIDWRDPQPRTERAVGCTCGDPREHGPHELHDPQPQDPGEVS